MEHPIKVKQLTTLTPLRGIAAILVVVFHSNLMLKAFLPPDVTGLLSEGWLWVDFFFILSGFILMYVYGQGFAAAVEKGTYKKYIVARFARVYPLNLFTLLITLPLAIYMISIAQGLDPFFATLLNPWAAPACAVFLQGMHLFSTAPLNTPSWSLSTEWWMYMIFPFFVPLFGALKTPGKLAVLLLIAAGYFGLMYYIGPLSGAGITLNFISDFAFLRCALGFFLGMWIHEIFKNKGAFSFFKQDTVFILLFGAILASMHFALHSLLTVSFFAFFILAAAYNEGSVKRVLDTRPLQRLGDWSFSIYMVHVPILYFFWIKDLTANPTLYSDFMALISMPPDYPLGLERLFILLPLTLVVAALTYRFVEIPSRNYINKRFATSKKQQEDNPVPPTSGLGVFEPAVSSARDNSKDR